MTLSILAWVSLSVAAVCSLILLLDELRHPQTMAIMNLVWPITALYFSILGVIAYFAIGRKMSRNKDSSPMGHPANTHGAEDQSNHSRNVGWRSVVLSASHCGAGCTLADVLCEYTVFFLSLTLLGQSLYASYLLDLVVAWLFGIAFQYFMIKPMKQLSPRAALGAAIKADTLSILFFQIGMYAWMALAYFVLFPRPHLHPTQATFWLMMQIGMIVGFLTTCPMNYWLVKSGVKESMG